MNRLIRTLLLGALLALGPIAAHAQRALVPVMDFHEIPVARATDKALTAEQVGKAIVAGGDASHWEIVPAGEGMLAGRFNKQNKHAVEVMIRYDAKSYSVLYKDSVNMKWHAAPYPSDEVPIAAGQPTRAVDAARKQAALFAASAESAYAKPVGTAVIHPFYERWVHDLLDAVRVSLRRAGEGA